MEYDEPHPVFRAQIFDEDVNHAYVEDSSPEDDTKKSFNFTGELKKLNESGASDRRSFVEKLENAFRTPARIDLKYDFGVSLATADANHQLMMPPVPRLSFGVGYDSSGSTMVITEGTSFGESQVSRDSLISDNEGCCSCLDPSNNLIIVMEEELVPQLRSVSSQSSKPSDGHLNTSFKFGGGKSSMLPPAGGEPPASRSRTLSDIIPPPSHHSRNGSSSSCMDEDSSVLKSIFAHRQISCHALSMWLFYDHALAWIPTRVRSDMFERCLSCLMAQPERIHE
jgi:serine/arginine repetitive matrix protein 2